MTTSSACSTRQAEKKVVGVLTRKATQTDEVLMRRVQANDSSAFGELYDRHVARALRVARSVGHQSSRAEDAVQEGFLAVWRSRESYRPEAGSFQAWAMTIIRHRAVDSIRSERAPSRPQQASDSMESVPDKASGSLQDEAIARSEGDALRASLLQLPDNQAEVITLAFFGELSHTEIAAQLSLPEGTVKGRMRLGLKKLRSQMQASG
jgi:RNA polymerase sigma-70 factor, ECF subfamily